MVGRERRVLSVIECGTGPCRRVVAGLAGGGEELWLRRVSRIRRVVVIRLVAPNTSDRQSGVVSVHMAIRALPWRRRVGAGQREGCVVVVEGGVGPDRGVVAQLAGCREARGGMGRRRCAGVILLVTRVAQRGV